eukprot:5623511-Prymnesium_polylepis.1
MSSRLPPLCHALYRTSAPPTAVPRRGPHELASHRRRRGAAGGRLAYGGQRCRRALSAASGVGAARRTCRRGAASRGTAAHRA